jgi:glycosyltransferase involved in cell wall biosynthesis
MKISVAQCTYNGEKYIAEQLCSIFCQDEYFIDEIQIGDDGSTDHTIDIPRISGKIRENTFNRK